ARRSGTTPPGLARGVGVAGPGRHDVVATVAVEDSPQLRRPALLDAAGSGARGDRIARRPGARGRAAEPVGVRPPGVPDRSRHRRVAVAGPAVPARRGAGAADGPEPVA